MKKTLLVLSYIFSIGYCQTETGATFLSQPVGARALGMGESYVAVAEDVTSMYWNPAALAQQQGFNLSYTHRPPILFDTFDNYEFLIFSYETKYGTIGFMGNLYDKELSSSSNRRDSYWYQLSIGYGIKMYQNIVAGISLKKVADQGNLTKAEAYVADIGFLYNLPHIINSEIIISDLSFGISIANLGNKLKYDGYYTKVIYDIHDSDTTIYTYIKPISINMPQIFRAGISYSFKTKGQFSQTGLSLFTNLWTVEYNRLLNDPAKVRNLGLGTELTFLEIIPFRLGYHWKFLQKESTYIGKRLDTGWTWGFGIVLPFQKLFMMKFPLKVKFDFGSAPQGAWMERYNMYTFSFKWSFN